MAVKFDNTNVRRKNPITRNSMFFSKESYDFETEMALDYMEQDMNQTVILYQVDLERTKVNDVYKEADKNQIVFKTPVELTCMYEIEDGVQESYDSKASKSVYVKPGTLKLRIMEATLTELNVDIKRGDYIGVQITPEKMIYYEVNNDGKVAQFANNQTLYGVRPFFRSVICNYVDENTFNG